MISIRNLVKSYGKNEPAVKGVSFEIGKGEIVGLLGPNGAGKTTIMKIITSYMNPTSGEVIIDGKNTIDDSLYTKSLIGYLPENSPQYDDMTVYEYLYFTAEIRGVKKDEIPQAIEKMVELTDLYNVVSKKIGELSKGYKKRVGLASVMIHDPQILILDEPTAGLDPNQIITFRKMLRRLAEKKTIIVSTHILSEIEAICERVIIIKSGRIVANDYIQNLIAKFSEDEFIEFSIEGDNLLQIENEMANVKGAWKIEFEKKDDRNVFRFKALCSKGSDFENNLKNFIDSKGYKLRYYEKNNANLEEIFLKLAGEEEESA
ncbi:MAG TPA: ABC transporter ATP-binding protein [Spirochaetota bacterium]|nr:ABC transporter ATP-binding protein [Spirochaetota bacterium]